MAWIYKLRVCLISTVAVILIVFAVAFSVLRAVLPHATGYVDEVEKELSRQTGLPVSISSIDADMYWLVPRLKLINVIIYDATGKTELFRLDEAIFSLAYIDSIISLSPKVGDISLIGTELYIERHPENRWLLQGMDISGGESPESTRNLIDIIRHTNLSLLDSDIHWHDYVGKSEEMDFIGVNIVIESFSDELYLEADMLLPQNYGDRFRMITRLSGNTDNLRTAAWDVYLEGSAINASRWLEKLDIAGAPETSGQIDGQAWFSMSGGTLSGITGDISVAQPRLISGGQNQQEWQADNVEMVFDWKETGNGWRLDIQNLSLVKNGLQWKEVSSATVIKNDVTGLYVSASYVRMQDFYGFAEVFADENTSTSLANFREARLAGDVYNLNLSLPSDESASPYLNATFSDMDFVLPGGGLSVKGMDGVVTYGGDEAKLELLTEYLEMDFNGLFRKPVEADLVEGVVTASQIDDGWRIISPDVHILNMDIEANTRIDIRANNNGSVFVDLQSDFRNAIGSSVSDYLPVTMMSNATVDWLDRSLVGGLVEQGSFIMRGYVSQFPYANNDGVMEVAFGASDLTLRFLEDWPEISEMSADVRFYNASMSVANASGKTYRGNIYQASAEIPNLGQPQLFVEGNVVAPAEDVQQYIWNSGLKNMLGRAMNQFHAEGNLDMNLGLDIPLYEEDVIVKTKGNINFDNNGFYFPVMQYTLSSVSGKLSFEGNELEASGITASFDGAPVLINIASSVNGSEPETIFHLAGALPVDGLLKKFDWIPKDWFDGESMWDVFVRVPHGSQKYDLLVETQSTLEGARINISDALTKPGDEIMHVELDLKVLGDAIQADLNSDDIVSLFATRDGGVWDFIVDSSLVRGSGEFAEDLNKDSTVRLELEYIDLPAMFVSSATGGERVSLSPTLFPSLSVSAKTLIWEKMTFDTVSLKTNWHPHGMLISSLDISSPSLKISGKGSWLSTWRHEHESTFNFNVSSSNLGHALSTLGITNRLARCEMNAMVDWMWLSEPYKFSISNVSGSAHAELRNGEVKDVQPGAGGRLMGLFNVFKLGDRLMLDFGDVYREGFAFESVRGDFEFQDGIAETTNVELKAAAADVVMLGKIGLAKQDYDLVMQVRPHTSAAAFTSGTLAGGPVIGTALVLVNKLFGLDELAYDQYQVTGSWDKPQVERVSKREGEKSGDGGDGDGS